VFVCFWVFFTTRSLPWLRWINEQVVQLFFNAVTNSSAPTVSSNNVSVTSPNVQLGQVPSLTVSSTFVPVQTIVTVPSSSAASGLNFGGSTQGGSSGIPQL